MTNQGYKTSIPAPPPFPKNRVEAISDGVFAVAMTLLVTDIANAEGVHLSRDEWFTSFWPRFVCVVYSFFVASMYWVAHHNELNMIRYVRRREFLWLNLLFLLCIVLLPFSAALLGNNWRVDTTPAGDWGFIGAVLSSGKANPGDPGFWYRRIPFVTYAVNLLLAGIALQCAWLHVSRHRDDIVEPAHLHNVEETTRRNRIIPLAVGVVAALGLLGPVEWAQWLVVGVPMFYASWTLWRAKQIRRERVESDRRTSRPHP
jgi:uncharacterized membrane protein